MSFLNSIFDKFKFRFSNRSGHKNSAVLNAQNEVGVKQNQQATNITNIHIFGDAAQKALGNFLPDNIEPTRGENVKKLDKRISEIPEERLQKIDTYKADNALRKMQTVSEPILVDMFVELLAKAADTKYSQQITPRYQELLSSLSPLEARLLQFIYKSQYVATGGIEKFPKSMEELLYETAPADIKSGIRYDSTTIHIPVEQGIPFLEIREVLRRDAGGVQYETINQTFTDLDKIDFIENSDYEGFSIQIDNLSSLGLLSVKTDAYFITPYDFLETHSYIRDLLRSGKKIHTIKGKIELTTLGKSLLNATIKEKEQKND